MSPPAASPSTRGEEESRILAGVLVLGVPGLLEAGDVGRSLLKGERRHAFDAVRELAKRGEIGPASVPLELVEAEVRRVGTEDQADAVRVVCEAAVGTFARDAARPGELRGAVERLADLLAEGRDQEPEGQAVEPLPRPLASSRLLDATFPPVAFAVDPQFPKGEVTELVGAHGIFKSTAALAACLSVATGRPWGPSRTVQGRAVFVTMEDSESTLARRARAWLDGVPAGKDRSDAEANVRARFAYLAREHASELALTSTDRTATTARRGVVDHLSAVLAGSSLVVLETASRLHDGPEMNEALAVFASAVERIAVSTGAAVCVVRHTSKQGARDGVTDSYAGRGGGSFSDAARSVLVMTRERRPDAEGGESEPPDALAPVKLTHAKSTHTAPASPIVWRPVVSEHGVYLYALSDREAEAAESRRLLAHLRELGGVGLTQSELHKRPPAGLSRPAALRAVKRLLAEGRVLQVEERRGVTKQPAVVYRAAGNEA